MVGSLLPDGLLHCHDSTVDVVVSAGLQALRKPVVLIVADVLACFTQEIKRRMQTAGMIGVLVDRRMVFQVLSIFNGCFPDLADSGIDTADRFDLVYRLRPVTGTMLDHPA